MNTLFCPKCYRNLDLSGWESDSAIYYYRCSRGCCEISFRENDKVCLEYHFSLPKLFSMLYAVSAEENNGEGNFTILYDTIKRKNIIAVKQFLPIDPEKTLPAQVEHIVKRLQKLIVFS